MGANASLKKLSQYSDLLAAGAVVLVVVMMIVPLPPVLLDLFITLNISIALAIVVATLYLPRALDFSSFPSLLLLTTLFRLAINVSVTRLILLEGNAGQITEEQARIRREDISREADFHGAMDGASKFVKGDAIAAILITLINLIGGIIVGVAQQDMPFNEAVQHFSLLTVGDGLTAQIPALLISVATGILVTRSASNTDLGSDVADQIMAQKKAPLVAGVVICAFALCIGFGLVPLVDQGAGGSLLQRVGAVRRQIAGELGTVIPSVRIHDEIGLASREYVLKVRGSEVARGRTLAGHQLALDPGDAVGQLNGVPTTEPAFGLPAVWIPDAARAEAEALGYTVVDPESVIVTHLTETIRGHTADLLTRQDTRALLDQLKEVNAAVVEEVVPELLSVGEIQRVLQALLREGVSVRDLGAIVEAVGDRARLTRDPSLLAEYARQALARAIVSPHLDEEQRLRVIVLDPALEQEVSDAIAATADGEYLAMDPQRAQTLVAGLSEQSEQALQRGRRPVLLCSSRVRRHLRRLCEQALPQVAVCAYNEIPPGVGVETMGVVAGAGQPVAA